MNLLCWLGIHKWGEWKVLQHWLRRNWRTGTELHPYKIKRECERCGETKVRHLKYKEV